MTMGFGGLKFAFCGYDEFKKRWWNVRASVYIDSSVEICLSCFGGLYLTPLLVVWSTNFLLVNSREGERVPIPNPSTQLDGEWINSLLGASYYRISISTHYYTFFRDTKGPHCCVATDTQPSIPLWKLSAATVWLPPLAADLPSCAHPPTYRSMGGGVTCWCGASHVGH